MKKLLFILLLSTVSLNAQTFKKDFYIDYPVSYLRDDCFKTLNHSDSMWIEELAFEDTVSRCFVAKTNDSNLIITYQLPRYDVTYVVQDDVVVRIYEIGKNHFWQYMNTRELIEQEIKKSKNKTH